MGSQLEQQLQLGGAATTTVGTVSVLLEGALPLSVCG